ncbi:citrate lyase holo-[acyl-carrier protein] synthase [Furfurilactobacillus siliginis]|uniref:citrate lyase holo-[acyl-carrier protein] synthase n=1 Tax=Furfurilactobacillus siliginis TaxID=348151 RepID=A0A0R2L869_9LACO|nr:citrate lyase holo-[acyl-carrier protein] synthase [Furfurilactobacillus siliginis]KRN94887.1 citX protein [Furfurilactobacillus siliginis]GEK28459.1 holo-ACP synthase CitX [Furfurilactobacillus siliginis]
MATDIFEHGTKQDIAAVLANKDARVMKQRQLAGKYPSQTIVALKLNVPGPIKNNDELSRLFDAGNAEWRHRLASQQLVVVDEVKWDKPTGREAFDVVDAKADQVKHAAVAFEDEFDLGRLFDVDVLMVSDGSVISLSRTNFGLPARRCLICGRPAKDCARSRRHSVAELQQTISTMYADHFGEGLI